MLARASLGMAIVSGSLALSSCSKPAPAPVSTVVPSDHVAPSPVGTSQTVLQKTFDLKDSETFPFEIPAHASQPHLHGIFESFLGKVHGVSDESSNIDFLIMNEEQESDLLANRASEALFSVESSHNQAVNFDLPASMSNPVKYYLVFRSSEKSKGNRVVLANFHVDF